MEQLPKEIMMFSEWITMSKPEMFAYTQKIISLSKKKLAQQKRIIDVLWQGRKDKQWKSKLSE